MLIMIKVVYGSLFAKTAQVKREGNVGICVEKSVSGKSGNTNGFWQVYPAPQYQVGQS